jgi:hypothetical protein
MLLLLRVASALWLSIGLPIGIVLLIAPDFFSERSAYEITEPGAGRATINHATTARRSWVPSWIFSRSKPTTKTERCGKL